MEQILRHLIPAAQAHEKWFIDASTTAYPVPDLFVTLNPATISAAIGIAAAIAALFFVDRWFGATPWYAALDRKLHHLRDYAAGILALTTSATLLWMSAHGTLFAYNLSAPEGPFGTALLGLQIVVALLFLIGLYTAGAAIGLLLLYGALFFLFPMTDAIDYLHYAGIGVFLLAFARGRFSFDWILGKGMLTSAETRKRAYLALRVITGIMMLVLALSKWSRPDLHLQLMDSYPDFNPYTLLRDIGGISMSREHYVFCLFVGEFLIGLTVLLGYLTRIVAASLIPVFIASVLFLGPAEMVGHLPIIGILFVFFVYGDTYHKGRFVKETSAQSESK